MLIVKQKRFAMVIPLKKRLLKRGQAIPHCSSFIFTGIKDINELSENNYTKTMLMQRTGRSIYAVLNNRARFRVVKQDFNDNIYIKDSLLGLVRYNRNYQVTVNDNFGKDILNDDCFM